MVRKQYLIIVIVISMLLMPLPLYARGGVGGGQGGLNSLSDKSHPSTRIRKGYFFLLSFSNMLRHLRALPGLLLASM
jgi:hypothetical protein